jgi:uncharacterized protein (DUF305 family)
MGKVDTVSFSAATMRRPAITADLPTEITVKGGDTLGAIAAKNGVTLAQLKELNPHLFQDGKDVGGKRRAADGHWIYPGDKVKLRPEAPAPASTSSTSETAPTKPADDSATVSAAATNTYDGYASPGTDSKTGSADYKSPGTDSKTGSADYKSPGTDSKTGSADYKSPGTDSKTGSADYKSPGTDSKTGSPNYTPPAQRDGAATPAARPTPTPTPTSTPAPTPAPAAAKTDDAPQNADGNLPGQHRLLKAMHSNYDMVRAHQGGISKADVKLNVADGPGRAEIDRDFDKYANKKGEVMKEDLERWIGDVEKKMGIDNSAAIANSATPEQEKETLEIVKNHWDKISDDRKLTKEEFRTKVATDLPGYDSVIRNFDKLAGSSGFLTKSDINNLIEQTGQGKSLTQIAASKR